MTTTEAVAGLTERSGPAVSVQAFMLCSAFNLDTGRFNILGGGVQSMVLEAFPTTFPLGLVVRFTTPGRPASLAVRIEVRLGVNGDLVLPPLELELDGSDDAGESATGGSTVSLPINLSPFVVDEPGDYWFSLFVNDGLITTESLAVTGG